MALFLVDLLACLLPLFWSCRHWACVNLSPTWPQTLEPDPRFLYLVTQDRIHVFQPQCALGRGRDSSEPLWDFMQSG